MIPRSRGPGRTSALAAVLGAALALPAFGGEPPDEPAAPEARASSTPALGGEPTEEPAAPEAPAPRKAPPRGKPAGEEEIVVVGRRPRAEAASDPTASATVVSAASFAGEAKDVAQLVATAPGVAVREYGGLGQLSTVSIRGSTSSGVLVLLDGLPLNTAAGGGVDLSTIPRSWISRVEIARGAEGARYGVGALGGVVNVVTAPPRAGKWGVEASAGSFGTVAAGAERAAGRDGLTLLSQVDFQRSDGAFRYDFAQAGNLDAIRTWTRHDNGSLRAGGLAKLAWTSGSTRLDALAQVSGGRRELPGWPWLSTGDWQEDLRALALARLSAAASPSLTLAGRAHVRADLLDLRFEDLGGNVVRQRGGAAGFEGQAVLEHARGTLRADAGLESETLSSDALDGTRSRASFHATLAEDLSALSGRLAVGPAVRVDRVGPFGGVSGKLGARWRIVSALFARASAGRSFRPPSVAELFMQQGLLMPNPDLRAEKGDGADAGLVYDGKVGLASIGAHATLYRDLIQYEATGLGRLTPRNSGKALVRGLEAELATTPLRAALGLALAASYTLLSTENLGGEPPVLGRDLPFRPRHRLYARASVAPGPVGLHAEAHYVGAQYQDARNLDRLPAALVWNAGASLRAMHSPELTIHVEVRNLLDDRTLQEPLLGPLPGRMVMVTVRAGSPAREGTP